jgi:hypothetical protein
MIKVRWSFLFVLLVPLISFAFTWTSVVQWVNSLNYDNSAWSVITKQAAISSNQIAANNIRTTNMLSIAIGAIDLTERQKKAILDYSASFGQPESNLCLAISQQNSFVKTMEIKNLDVNGRMTSFSNRATVSQADLNHSLQKLHLDFCSVSESRQGLCTLKSNGMQAWDIDYSGYSSKNNLEGSGEVGAIAYVKRVSTPPIFVDTNCKSDVCINVRIQNMAYMARSSMITNTLLSQISIRKNSLL